MKYLIITEADWQSLRDEVLSLATCCLKAFGEESKHTDWLHNGDVCRLLGIEERRLKQLIRDRVLIEERADNGVRGVPQDVLVKGANGWEPLPFLQGTLTLLADDGFTAEESLAWLYAEQDELGERPIDALTSGRHHRVNRIASTLAF